MTAGHCPRERRAQRGAATCFVCSWCSHVVSDTWLRPTTLRYSSVSFATLRSRTVRGRLSTACIASLWNVSLATLRRRWKSTAGGELADRDCHVPPPAMAHSRVSCTQQQRSGDTGTVADVHVRHSHWHLRRPRLNLATPHRRSQASSRRQSALRTPSPAHSHPAAARRPAADQTSAARAPCCPASPRVRRTLPSSAAGRSR